MTFASSACKCAFIIMQQPSIIQFNLIWVGLFNFVTNPFLLQAKHDDPNWWKNAKSIYEFTANDIDGNEVSLDKYR